jgi:hypothetical protein
MKKKTEKKPEVMIVWASTKEHLDKGEIHVLDSYVGPRKYLKDELDPRLTMGSDQKLPFAQTWQEAVFFMGENLGKPVQLLTSVGKRVGLLED